MQYNKRPEISVIVPVYRVEKYLNTCIDSILRQTFADFELILVDDGSPDGCPALCDAAAEKDPRVRVIHQKNKGLSGARNAGLDAAQGNWIAFVDSDDMVMPSFLEKLHDAAERENAEVAICDTRTIDEKGIVLKESDNLLFDEVLSQRDVIEQLPLSAFQVSWNKLYQKHIFETLRFPQGRQNEDTFTSPLVYQKIQRMVCIRESLYCYRIVQGSIMHRRITLKTLDRVEACYQMFLVMYEQKADTLCLAYRMVLTGLVDIWLHLTPAERKSPRMKECIGCERDAWRKLKQAHGITPRAVWDTLVYTVSPPRYAAARHRRLAKKAAAAQK